MEKAFRMFDSDQNGFIEKNELSTILGGTELSEETWNDILHECDANGDGKVFIYLYNMFGFVLILYFQISQAEFISLLDKKIATGEPGFGF